MSSKRTWLTKPFRFHNVTRIVDCEQDFARAKCIQKVTQQGAWTGAERGFSGFCDPAQEPGLGWPRPFWRRHSWGLKIGVRGQWERLGRNSKKKSAPANPAYAQWFFYTRNRKQSAHEILLFVKDSSRDGRSTHVFKKVRTRAQREIWPFKILFYW